MTDRPHHVSRWRQFAAATLVTVGFAVVVAWIGRSYGRTVGFAFGLNWILMAWATSLGRVLESRPGAWNGLSIQLPEWYYVTRPFERSGRVYDRLGVRRYQRLFRRWLWSVNPFLLRSQDGARQTMVRATRDPEAGHLVIFVAIMGFTLWAVGSGWWDTAAWLLLFNLLHNGYPLLSMRQIRARLDHRDDVGDRKASGQERPRAAAEPQR
jgi:hypothetical protein